MSGLARFASQALPNNNAHYHQSTKSQERTAMAEGDQAKRDLDLQQHLSTGKNPRGIPHVVFIVSCPQGTIT